MIYNFRILSLKVNLSENILSFGKIGKLSSTQGITRIWQNQVETLPKTAARSKAKISDALM